MPENKTFKEESQLSENISILLVAYVQVKLSAVEVRLFLAKIAMSFIGKNSNGHRLPNSIKKKLPPHSISAALSNLPNTISCAMKIIAVYCSRASHFRLNVGLGRNKKFQFVNGKF